ncbi:hypothetical protein B0H14DRAFT_2652051 [Mycena olivaceomarginata]|nr:hypothetical protein B0H14DRAFT_2652051 [Mycena olivaceomarginata]
MPDEWNKLEPGSWTGRSHSSGAATEASRNTCLKATTGWSLFRLGSTRQQSWQGTTAQSIPVTGDGGCSAPGGHTLNDCPEKEGDIAMGGAEDLTHRDEPERASGMRGADDTPSTAPMREELQGSV